MLRHVRALADAAGTFGRKDSRRTSLEHQATLRRAGEQLRQALCEQELILNNATVGIAFLKNRIVHRCNRRYEEMYGAEPGKYVGRPSADLYVSPDEHARVGREMREAAAAGCVYETEIEQKRMDGSVFWARMRGKAIDSQANDWIWICEDVTENKTIQEALLRTRVELELRVQERTRELALANERLQQEIAERMEAEKRIQRLADHDVLTGLPNRRLLNDRLGQALALARRNSTSLAVLFVDLDRFKTINDSLGHMLGDKLLQSVSDRLVCVLRSTDTVCRHGGDEFVVMLPEVSGPDGAAHVAQKIIDTLARAFVIQGQTLHVSASVGVSIYPSDGQTSDELLSRADAALYHSKELGRNNYQFFTAHMSASAAQRLQLETEMHRALERDEFFLFYQPRIDLASGKVAGLEALLRWRHPEMGMISPARFIPVAEETGLILPIGEQVLRKALSQAAEWDHRGLLPRQIAVNLSPRQFRQLNLVSTITKALKATGFPPAKLALEITETSLMQQTSHTLDTLVELNSMGISMAIDDFGIGYSSLSYLKRFPVDQLKIDRSFVRDVSTDSDDAAIVSAIIALAQKLELTVVAEGVETEEQLRYVAEAGCHEAQGYLLGRPLSSADALRYLEQATTSPLHPLAMRHTP
jgi:diguanylate cyclase (GGDEF)-like protein/PAS domain S-box-containing protein